METNNDKRIREFLLQQKTEVADDSFTDRVMSKIPAQQKNYEWIIVLLAAIGTVISLIIGWNTRVPTISITLPSQINLLYILGGIALSPFVVWLCFELFRTKQLRLF